MFFPLDRRELTFSLKTLSQGLEAFLGALAAISPLVADLYRTRRHVEFRGSFNQTFDSLARLEGRATVFDSFDTIPRWCHDPCNSVTPSDEWLLKGDPEICRLAIG